MTSHAPPAIRASRPRARLGRLGAQWMQWWTQRLGGVAPGIETAAPQPIAAARTRRLRGAGRARRALPAAVGSALARRAGGARGAAGAHRSFPEIVATPPATSLRRPRVARIAVFFAAAAVVPARQRVPDRARGARAPPEHGAAPARVHDAAVPRRDRADEFRGDQSRGPRTRAGDRGHEPRAGHRQPRRRPRAAAASR